MRTKKWTFCMIALLLLSLLIPSTALAGTTSAYTYVVKADGDWQRSQDAYLPESILFQNEGLKQPEDLFIKGNHIYVADTGNCRVVEMNLNTGETRSIGEEILQAPTGIYISDDHTMYVADGGLGAVICFDETGKEIRRYERPTDPAFGTATQYAPKKVTVGDDGVLYIVSSGSYDGIIQLDSEGSFLGYFGYNDNSITAWDWIVDRIFTDEQKAKILNTIPLSFGNIVKDDIGTLYTTTMGTDDYGVKKHDASGINLFQKIYGEKNFVDLCIGSDGQIYAVTETGIIDEYDVDGNLLFSLGGLAASREMVGLFTRVSAVDCNSDGQIFVLDQERGLVHSFQSTEFADMVHEAMADYNAGRYEKSEEIWHSVSKISGTCQMVDNGLGNCAFQRHDYRTAAKYYRLAENRKGYSDSYWQIRNDQLSVLLPWLIVAIIVLEAASFFWRKYRKKHDRKVQNSRTLDNLKMVFTAVRHPIDTFYSIRFEGKGDYLTSTLIYLMLYLVFVFNYLMRGFVISYANTENTSLLFVTLVFLVPLTLFLGCNFLVGEINESKARFRDIYIGVSYVAAPFLVIMPFIILISHVATLNESRILSLASLAIYIWVAVMLVIFIKEVHMYLLRDVVKNLAITVFLMAVVILALSFLGMFFDQIWGFVIEVVKEVQLRVR